MAYGLLDLASDAYDGSKDLLKTGAKWLAVPENQKALGTVLQGAGTAYGAYAQSKYAKDLLKLQKAQYARGIKREDEAEDAMQQGFLNSGLGNNGLVKLG